MSLFRFCFFNKSFFETSLLLFNYNHYNVFSFELTVILKTFVTMSLAIGIFLVADMEDILVTKIERITSSEYIRPMRVHFRQVI